MPVVVVTGLPPASCRNLPSSTAYVPLLAQTTRPTVSPGYLQKAKHPYHLRDAVKRQRHDLWSCCLLTHVFFCLSIQVQVFRYTLKQAHRAFVHLGLKDYFVCRRRAKCSRLLQGFRVPLLMRDTTQKTSTVAERRNRTSKHTRIRVMLATCAWHFRAQVQNRKYGNNYCFESRVMNP